MAVNITVVDLSFIILISDSVLPKESHPNRFCAWLSLQSRKELSEPGICYRQPTHKDEQKADSKIQLLRFQVPPHYAQLA
ncbi:hypothetical protein RintRC_1474 [Richelia intracellularis]|nr:hypothetical protein RintRC_1474 [Richelia intracellularis]